VNTILIILYVFLHSHLSIISVDTFNGKLSYDLLICEFQLVELSVRTLIWLIAWRSLESYTGTGKYHRFPWNLKWFLSKNYRYSFMSVT